MAKSSDHFFHLPASESVSVVSRSLIRSARKAYLNSLNHKDDNDPALTGWPSASMVTVAAHWDSSPILMLSDIAHHAKNIAADNRVALLFDSAVGAPNPQEDPRVSVVGRLVKTDDSRLHQRYIARHPRAALYAGFADFNFYVLKVEKFHFVGGFARATWINKSKALLAKKQWADLADREQDILNHMNADHGDALRHYGGKLLGKRGKSWAMTGLDPEGCDLKCGAGFHRLNFKEMVNDSESCRKTLVELAH